LLATRRFAAPFPPTALNIYGPPPVMTVSFGVSVFLGFPPPIRVEPLDFSFGPRNKLPTFPLPSLNSSPAGSCSMIDPPPVVGCLSDSPRFSLDPPQFYNSSPLRRVRLPHHLGKVSTCALQRFPFSLPPVWGLASLPFPLHKVRQEGQVYLPSDALPPK